MAAGNFTFFDIGKLKVLNGTIDLDTDTIKAALTTSSQALSASFSGSSTDARYADLTNEATGTGYTAGGQALSSTTLSQSSGTVTYDAADLTWSALTSTFKYLVLYDDTAANKDLIGFWDLNTSGSVTLSGSDLTITFDATGIFTAA